MTNHVHEIDDEVGNGSRSRIEDEKTGDKWNSKDQRANTNTTFFESDINSLDASPRRKRRLKRLLRRQEGEHVNADDQESRGQQNHNEWQRRVALTYSEQLSLTDAQKRRVVHLVTDVMSIDSFGPYSVEDVTVATINVVARKDGWQIESDEEFQDLMVDVGITNDDEPDMETLSRLRVLVRERVPSYE